MVTPFCRSIADSIDDTSTEGCRYLGSDIPIPKSTPPESNAGIFTGCATLQDRRILIPSDNVLPGGLQLGPQIPQIRVEQRPEVIRIAPRKGYIDRVRNIRYHGESLREQRHPVLIQCRRKAHIGSVGIHIRAGCLTDKPAYLQAWEAARCYKIGSTEYCRGSKRSGFDKAGL